MESNQERTIVVVCRVRATQNNSINQKICNGVRLITRGGGRKAKRTETFSVRPGSWSRQGLAADSKDKASEAISWIFISQIRKLRGQQRWKISCFSDHEGVKSGSADWSVFRTC